MEHEFHTKGETLEYYLGPGGDVVIPDGIAKIGKEEIGRAHV